MQKLLFRPGIFRGQPAGEPQKPERSLTLIQNRWLAKFVIKPSHGYKIDRNCILGIA